MGFWKNKLYPIIKRHDLPFPDVKIIAKAECIFEIHGEPVVFSIPLPINKNIKKESMDYIYAEIYETFMNKKKKGKKAESLPAKPKVKVTIIEQPPLKPDNVGYTLLEKLGWKKGEGLGVDGSGITEPIPLVIREKKKGL
jgi:hypothetical protein